MINRRVNFDYKELAIINILRRHPNRFFTTNEMADLSKMSWNTAEKTLNELFKRGYLRKGRKGRRIYWRLVQRHIGKEHMPNIFKEQTGFNNLQRFQR